MTSLFSHGLLNDTDRNVQGAYKTFSRVSARVPLLRKGSEDRSSATMSPPREDFSVVAKEMAKTQSLAASFRNISSYLSTVERARDTLQAVEIKLTELDNVISAAAEFIDINDYFSMPVGAILSADISGTAVGSGTFASVSPIATSGSGKASTFTIRANGSGSYEIVNIDSEGSGYAVDDTITIAGADLGGTTPLNDAAMTVKGISNLNKLTTKLKLADDDIDRLTLQLQANKIVDDISAIINGSKFWDEEIFGGLRAIGYAQVGHTSGERTLIDIQALSTSTIGSYLNAYYVNSNFNAASDLEGSYVEEAPTETSGTLVSLYGWDIRLEQVALGPSPVGSDAANGLISASIGGFQTPTDPTPTPQNTDSPAQVSRGDDYRAQGGSFSYNIAGDGLQLISDNLRVNGGDVTHGPYLISKTPVALESGDKLSFRWRGEVTDNAYDVYAYLLNADTGGATELLDSHGNATTGWSTVTQTVTADASYYFVFVAGSFEYDFIGSIIGASASGNSPVNGAIAASVSGTAGSGINSVTAGGTSNGTASFSNVSQSLTSGNGSGAQFNVSANGAGNYNVEGISAAGNGYQIGDSITIAGASLGGTNGVNDLNLTVSALTAASYSVAQSSTNGSGSGAMFNVTSDSNGNYAVSDIPTFGSNYALNDQVVIAGSNLGGTDADNDATLTLTAVGATTIANVTQTSTTGTGSGAIFTIAIDGAGNYSVTSINSAGNGYEEGDSITFSGANLGGTSSSNDLTVLVENIETLSGAILHLDDVSVTRNDAPPTVISGIDVSTKNSATEAITVITDAIKQIKYRDSYLAGKEAALKNSINAISTQKTASNLLVTDLAVQDSLRQLKKTEVIKALTSDIQQAKYMAKIGMLQLI